MDPTDDLDAYMAGEVGLVDGPFDAPVEEPAPGDRDTINRLLRWRARDQRLIAELEEAADKERARVNDWLNDRSAGLRRHVAEIERAVENWTRKSATDKVRSFATRYGRPQLTRPGGGAIEVIDEAAFVEWASKNQVGLLRYAPAKAAIADMASPDPAFTIRAATDKTPAQEVRLLTIDGEVLPGVIQVRKAQDSFSIVTPKAEP